MHLDFARKKNKLPAEQTTHNETLAERFNKSGLFPNIILINPEEKVLINPKFNNQTPEQFISDLENGKETCQIGKALIVLERLGIELVPQSRDGKELSDGENS